LQVPLVALATAATIIASQSIISGTFSMTRQAIQLGLCPRLHITQTSSEGYGQIYVGFVNWALMVLTLGLALTFRSSDNLASAFGIAVALTMLLTSLLMFLAMREVWGWSLPLSVAVAGLFTIDSRGKPPCSHKGDVMLLQRPRQSRCGLAATLDRESRCAASRIRPHRSLREIWRSPE
jgi:K+ transporter